MYPLRNQDPASWKFSDCALSWLASSLSCTLGPAWKFKEGSCVSKPDATDGWSKQGAIDGWSKQGATDGWSSTTCTAFNFRNVFFVTAYFSWTIDMSHFPVLPPNSSALHHAAKRSPTATIAAPGAWWPQHLQIPVEDRLKNSQAS